MQSVVRVERNQAATSMIGTRARCARKRSAIFRFIKGCTNWQCHFSDGNTLMFTHTVKSSVAPYQNKLRRLQSPTDCASAADEARCIRKGQNSTDLARRRRSDCMRVFGACARIQKGLICCRTWISPKVSHSGLVRPARCALTVASCANSRI